MSLRLLLYCPAILRPKYLTVNGKPHLITLARIDHVYDPTVLCMKFSAKPEKPVSPRLQEFKKKLRETSPIERLEEISGAHPHQEKEPLEEWPNNTNPVTGEVGGPRGPEPTRYGDWERKGRVSDF